MLRIASLCGCVAFAAWAAAAPGDWPEPRQNAHLTGIQPMPGTMAASPSTLARLDLGRGVPSLRIVEADDGASYVGLALVAGSLLCFEQSGAHLWACHPAGLNFTKIEAVGDFDLDGKQEIALMAGRTAEPFGAAVLISLAEGKLLWRYDVEPMSYAWYLHIDEFLPKSKGQQIIVLMHGYPPDTKNGYIALFEYPEAGGIPMQRWRYDFDHYTCFPSLLRSDLDGDGVKEIVVETHSRMWFLDAMTGEPKHFIMWDVSPANNRSYGLVEFVDLDLDGREDFLCIGNFAQHHEVLLNKGGAMELAWTHGWPESVTTRHVATVWPEPPYGDVDGDGRLEIVLSMYNSEGEEKWLIRVYDAVTGDLKYRLPGMLAAGLEDCTGDGRPEILANVCDDPAETVTRGARLLGVRDGHLEVLWQDDGASAVRPQNPKRHNPERRKEAHFVRGEAAFEVTRDSQAGWSESAWAAPAKKAKPSIPAPALIGPQPMPELLVARGADRNVLLVYQGSIAKTYRLDDGELIPIAEYTSSCLPALADLDGHDGVEVITARVSPDRQPVVETFTLESPPRSFWQIELPPTTRVGFPHGRMAYLRTGRFTGKTTADVYAWTGTPLGRSTLLDGQTGEIIWETGEMKEIERYAAPTINLASTWDFNRDGAEDLVYTAPDYFCVGDGKTGGFLFGPLFPPKVFNQSSQGLYTFPAVLEQSQGEPLIALVGGHYFQGVMTLKGEPRWYRLPEAGQARCAQEAFLRLPSGEWLMGVGRQNGRFVCVHVADGTVRWELPLEASASDAAVCDIDGDGNLEFIFGTSHGVLWAVGDDGGTPRTVWQCPMGAGVGAPIVADLTGDGRSDIVVPTTDGYVHILGNAAAGTH